MAQQMIQESFAAGELSERLRGRYSTELYKKGLAYCENFMPTPQGSIFMRGPSRDLGVDFGDLDSIRYIPMRTSDGSDFVIVLTHHAFRLFSVDGGVLITNPGSTQELLSNGNFSSPIHTGWTTWPETASVINEDGGAEFHDGVDPGYGYKFARLSQNFTVIDPVDVIFSVDVSTATPEGISLIIGGPLGSSNAWPTSPVLVDVTINGTGTYTRSLHLNPGTYGLMLQGSLTSDGVTKSKIDNVSIAYSTAGGEDGYTSSAPWSENQLSAIQYVEESAGDRVYFAHPNVRPYRLERTGSGWTLQPVTFTDQPSDWIAGNYPCAIEISNGRLTLGGTPTARNRVWASRADRPTDFTLDTDGTVVSSDAIDAKIATKGAIRWFASRRVLLVGTDLGEGSLVGTKGSAMTALDREAIDQSDFGSAPIQAVRSGNHALYVSPDRRKIRAIEFNLQTNGWDTKDVTFIAEHITSVSKIKELHFIRHPDPILFGLLDDGTFIACTWDPAEQVTAWWRLTIRGNSGANAVVKTAAVTSGPDGSFLWTAVLRNGTVRMERIRFSFEANPIVIDSSVERVVSSIGEITGLEHLNGCAVRVVLAARNALLEGEFTVASGKIAISSEYSGLTATVGFKVTAKGITLPKLKGTGKIRSPKIGVLLNRSALPLINGKRPADRSPSTALDSGEPLRTGKFDVGNLGWDGEGQVTLEQDLPFRTEILGIFEDAQANNI